MDVLVNRVFKLFKDNWPRKFPSIWPSVDAVNASKRMWKDTFMNTPWLTLQRFDLGLNRVRSESWPPDNPADFLKHCHIQPADIGAPEQHAAFRIALNNCHQANKWPRWKHKCVYWAAVEVGLSDMFRRGEATRKHFYEVYQRHLNQHESLQGMPVAYIESTPKESSDRCQQEHRNSIGNGLDDLKKMLARKVAGLSRG